MMGFFQKFFWDGFVSGNYEYGITHILAILVTISCAILLPRYLKDKSDKTTWRILRVIAVFTLGSYILRRVIGFSLGGDKSTKNF